MSYRRNREVRRQTNPLLLHKVFKQSFPCSVVGEGEVELLLSERLYELLIDLPRSVGAGDDCHSVFLLQHLLLVFGKWLT